jgi:glutaryl-CoA dehydrogenase
MITTRLIRTARPGVRFFGSGTVFEKFNFEDAFDLNG